LRKLDNHDQEQWKAPLPQFIEHLYEKRFGRARPDVVVSVEERARAQDAKKAARKEARHCRLATALSMGNSAASASTAGGGVLLLVVATLHGTGVSLTKPVT